MLSRPSHMAHSLIGLPCGPCLTMDYNLDGDRKLQGIKEREKKEEVI